jgi:hypothetical protein
MRCYDWILELYIKEVTQLKEKKDAIQSKQCKNNQRSKTRKTT